MNCPESDILFGYLDGQLRPRRFRDVEKHVATCESCRENLARHVADESLLREALAPPPDIERLAREVVERLKRGEGGGEVPEE